ncbi:MAG: carboxypeptidase regulatory-like domain-containing protein [Candidatus Diapherotrites archaeon]
MANGQSGIYSSLEEKFYGFLDALDAKGIPVYKIVDPLEKAGVPAFPLFIILALLVIAALAYLTIFVFNIVPLNGSLTVSVIDSDGALQGATVTIKPEGAAALDPKTTDAEGKAVFSVPMGKELSITAKKTDYLEDTKPLTLNESTGKITLTLEKETLSLKKTVQLMKAGTTQLIDDDITVNFSCSSNSSYTRSLKSSSGLIQLNDVPSDCGLLYVKPSDGYSTADDSFSVSETSAPVFEIRLSGQGTAKGTALVVMTNADGAPLVGISASLKDSSSGVSIATKTTLSAGSTSFTDVPAGKYYVTSSDPSGEYAEYDSSVEGMVKEIAKAGDSISFSIKLTKKTAGSIRLLVKDAATQQPVQNATITVSKGNTSLTPKQTDADGKAEFKVSENVEYDVRVDHANYLLYPSESDVKKFRPSSDYQQILLTQATAENSRAVIATVLDEKGRPVEDVRLQLKQLPEGVQVGEELLTGANGKATFSRVDTGQYFVYAFKPGFGEQSSTSFTVQERSVNELPPIRLAIGEGEIELNVLDEKNQPIAGANIKAVNLYSSGAIEAEGTTASDGVKKVKIRADKAVFFRVSAQGLMPYTTVPTIAPKDTTQKISVMLLRDISSFEVKLEAILLSTGETVQSGGISPTDLALNPGQKYIVQFKLLVPKGAAFNEAGIHIRTGADQSTSIEKDSLFIADAIAATGAIVKGTTYNPPTGYATDAQHLTTGNAKWVNLVMQNVSEGVIEAVAEIQVKETAPMGSKVDLWFRGWGKTGSYVRFPQDTSLGSAESTGEKQALYAQAKNQPFTIGPSNLCSEEFCATTTIENVAQGIQTTVIDEYPAKVSQKYKLRFALTSLRESVMPMAELKLANDSGSITLGEYQVTDVSGGLRKGTEDSSELSLMVGDVKKNDIIAGIVEFTAKKEGAAILELSLVSDNEKAFSKEIVFNVSAAAQMNMDLLPKVIVPFVNNIVLVRASAEDGTALSNASITVKKDNDAIASGQTNSEGVFQFTLTSPNAGVTIKIQAEKNGYASIAQEIAVNENILTTIPSTLSEQLIVGAAPEKQTGFLMRNATQIPFEISDIKASGFEDYAAISFDESIIGTVLDVNSDANTTISISLAGKSFSLTEPKKIDGTISIFLSNNAAQKTWVASIPLTVRIGFGGEVDDETCFNFFPDKWEIFSGGDKKTISLTLNNQCTVGGNKTPLKNLSAKIVQSNQPTLGSFKAGSDLDSSRSVSLTTKAQLIAENIPSDAQNTVTLEFLPDDIQGGAAKIALELSAVNLTEQGNETLSQKLNVTVNVNNLIECLQVNQDQPLIIETSPFNTGYGQYNNYSSGYNPLTGTGTPSYVQPAAAPINAGLTGGYANNYAAGIYPSNYTYSGVQPTTSYSALSGSSYYPYNYPSTNYNQPYYAGDQYNSSYNNSWNYGSKGTSFFTLRNNCASEVEVQLSPDPALIVTQSSLSIAPLDESRVDVQSAYFVGNYPLKVSARVKGSSEAFKEIATLNAIVQNELINGYRDCISVSPYPTLQFNSYLSKPVKLTVTNTCFNSGVRLLESNDTLQFQALGTAYPAQPLQQPFGAGATELISNAAYRNASYSTDPSGKVTQRLDFDIVKNTDYYMNQAPPFPTDEQNFFQQIGGLRYFTTRGYYAVRGNANLTVNALTKYGSSVPVTFNMTVEDMWAALPYGEQVVSYGDSTTSAKACIKSTDLLDLKKAWAGAKGSCIPAGAFEKGVYVYSTKDDGGLFNFAKRDATGKEVGGCGSMDKITKLIYDEAAFSGKGVSLKIANNGHDIEIRVVNTGSAVNIEKEPVVAVVTRVLGAKTAKVVLPVRLCVQGETTPPICDNPPCGTTIEGKECEGLPGTTEGSSTQFEAYGLDKLLFKWDIKDSTLNKSTCNAYLTQTSWSKDASPNAKAYFCDAAQFGLSLLDKAAALKTTINSTTLKTCKEESEGICVKDSLNLFRHLLDQVEVSDPSGKYVFFKDEEGKELLENAPLLAQYKDKEGLYKDLKAAVDSESSKITTDFANPANNRTTVSSTKTILEKLAESPAFSDNLVAKIDVSSFSAENKTILNKLIGQEAEVTLNGKLTRFMTFNEFKTFEEAIEAKCGLNKTDASCTNPNGTIQIGTATVNVSFMQALLNSITFTLGVRNKADLSEAEKKYVMEREGILDEYTEDVEFNALLMKDGYSNDFKSDFEEVYETEKIKDKIGVKFNEWVFVGSDDKELSAPLEAGRYKVQLIYNFEDKESPSITVKFFNSTEGDDKFVSLKDIDAENKEANSGEDKTFYEKNIWFSTPLDGALGIDSGSGRDGYGTGFDIVSSALNDNEPMFFNSKEETKINADVSDGAIKLKLDYYNSFVRILTSNIQGRLLNLTGSTIDYSPVAKKSESLRIAKSRADTSEIGVVYQLRENDKALSGPTEMLNWLVTADSTGGARQGSVVADAYMNTDQLCANTLNEGYGLAFSADKTGSVELKTDIYAPIRWNLVLKNLCEKDSSSFGDTEPIFTGNKTLFKSQYSLADIVKHVGESDYCFVSEADKFQVFYKPLEGIGAQ